MNNHTNPCSCIGKFIKPSMPSVSNCAGGNCLLLCHVFLNQSEAVGPCGKTGMLNVNSSDNQTSVCGDNPLVWKYVSHTGYINSVSVTEAGVLTWTTEGPNTAGEYSEVILLGSCGLYGKYIKVLIGTKDECEDKNCQNTCDPCTGLCIELQSDLSVEKKGSGIKSSGLKITG